MKRSQKEEIVDAIAEKATKASAMYFADFKGLTVAEETELRREFRKSGVEYKVVKNTLARKALERVTGFDKAFDKLVGPTGIAFTYDDVVVPAKVIKKFNEKTGKLTLKVAVIEKQVYEGSRLDDLAKLPTRKEMIASIAGSVQAPIAGVAGAVAAVILDLVNVIDAIERKKAA
jgi:large subunit ribosomal protein L10